MLKQEIMLDLLKPSYSTRWQMLVYVCLFDNISSRKFIISCLLLQYIVFSYFDITVLHMWSDVMKCPWTIVPAICFRWFSPKLNSRFFSQKRKRNILTKLSKLYSVKPKKLENIQKQPLLRENIEPVLKIY